MKKNMTILKYSRRGKNVYHERRDEGGGVFFRPRGTAAKRPRIKKKIHGDIYFMTASPCRVLSSLHLQLRSVLKMRTAGRRLPKPFCMAGTDQMKSSTVSWFMYVLYTKNPVRMAVLNERWGSFGGGGGRGGG